MTNAERMTLQVGDRVTVRTGTELVEVEYTSRVTRAPYQLGERFVIDIKGRAYPLESVVAKKEQGT